MGSQEHSLSKMQASPLVKQSSRDYAEWITTELVKIAVLMGEEISQERYAMTIAELQDIQPNLLEYAFAVVRKEGRYFPRPGDIREIISRDPMAKMKFINTEAK